MKTFVWDKIPLYAVGKCMVHSCGHRCTVKNENFAGKTSKILYRYPSNTKKLLNVALLVKKILVILGRASLPVKITTILLYTQKCQPLLLCNISRCLFAP